MGIYRMQVIGPNKVIMRWLSHRGGALDFRDWQLPHPGQPFPVAVALGADPATILAAVTPVPDNLAEHAFAGLLRGKRTELVKCIGSDLTVPASSEIVLEGLIHPGEMAPEGPFGDHTGYYNEVDASPVSGLGGKMGLDATGKWPGETAREWGRPIVMDEDVKRRVDELWDALGL